MEHVTTINWMQGAGNDLNIRMLKPCQFFMAILANIIAADRAVNEPSRVEFEFEILLNESSLIDKVNDHFLLFELEFVKNRVELELVANNSRRIEFESSRAVRENLIF